MASKPRRQASASSKKALSMAELLSIPDKGASLTTSPLARIWRIMLVQSNISGDKWRKMLERYIKRRANLEGTRAASWTKGNMSSRMCEDSLTLSQFLRGMDLMEYDEVDITITGRKFSKLRDKDGKPLMPPTECTASVTLDYVQISSSLNDLENDDESE